MSRRRRPSHLSDRWKRVVVKCGGTSNRPHAEQRVATITARLGVDPTDLPYRLKVDYGSLGEPESPTGHIRPGADVHSTHVLPCKRCGQNVPARADKLVVIVMAHVGASPLWLADIRAMLSKQ